MKKGQHTQRASLPGVISALCMVGLFSAGLSTACNTNTVEYITSTGGVTKSIVTSIDGQKPMDILWVVDNSFSMCQEQKVLRDNFDGFVDILARTNLDFHIALTTTHAPEGAGVIEPIAKEAQIQSTPQPVPGNNQGCLRGEGPNTEFAPLRESLEVAKRCLADPSQASNYEWTDAQIDCALQSSMRQSQSGCVASSGLADADGNSRYDIFDLFPASSDYRAIPKVLKASDYRGADGQIDQARLTLDFACMATVGTRGDGYEKGLRAAVKAVSPEFTGGPAEGVSVNTDAVNHGFIRAESGFALIFVTDENDCSHDSSIMELGNECGANICEYMNSAQAGERGNALIDPEVFAQELRENLAKSKGLTDANQLIENNLLIASINGTSKRYNEPFPACAMEKPEISAACSSALGSAFSGDRYERFMRQFQNFYPRTILDDKNDPRSPEEIRTDFSKYEPVGWMCTDTFAPALLAIAEFIAGDTASCINENVYPCETDADCPEKLFAGVPGTCQEKPNSDGLRYCDSGIALTIERNPLVEAVNPDVNALDYCLPGSIGQLDTANPSCVIDPSRYSFGACAGDTEGVQFNWVEPADVVANKLSGYTLETVFAIDPGSN